MKQNLLNYPEENLDEMKSMAIHSGLFKSLLLINEARDLIQSSMDGKETERAGQWQPMDNVVTLLNDSSVELGSIIGSIVSLRVEDATGTRIPDKSKRITDTSCEENIKAKNTNQ